MQTEELIEQSRALLREYDEAFARGEEPAFPLEAWRQVKGHEMRAQPHPTHQPQQVNA